MSDALAPGTRLGPYEIEALIGAGGLGRVYRARDPRLSRSVAIKTLSPLAEADPEGVRRFESEARTVGALDHPNLLVVYDVGREGGVPYLVSELLQGETLRDRLRRQGALPERQAIDLIAQAARGLATAHARGFVHRDLKPENLFLTQDRRLKILDFGIAKRVAIPGADSVSGAGAPLTVTGAIMGTVGYMAPEQVLGEAVDARADLFALGVVLHELLTGSAPFQRDSAIATLTAILSDDPPALPSTVSSGLAHIVQRCLAKSREERFHSAHDLSIALELVESASGPARSLAAAGPAAADPGAAASGAGAMPRRRLLTMGAASLALLATGAAGSAWLGLGGRRAVAPSFRRLTFRRGLIRSARMAPDGQTLLFGALWDDGPCRVHTVRLDGPESRALDLPDANVLAISRSGELAITLGAQRDGIITYGTLARVPLSGGAPRELAVDVKFADWSPDGSELAIVRRVDGIDRLEYPMGTVLVAPKAGEHTGLGFARVAPDGRHVAFVEYLTPGSLMGRIAIVDRSGTVTRLTEDFLNVHGLTWRGTEIWFTAGDEQPLFRAVRAIAADGRSSRGITRAPTNLTLWDALPDGRLALAQTDDRAVMVMRRDGESRDRDLSWLDASWVEDISRDGRQILFTESGQGGGPRGTIYLRGTDGAPAVRLGTGQAYALSPDGRWAACAGGITEEGVTSMQIDLIPTGAGDARRLDGAGISFFGARWLPDGERLVAFGARPGERPRLFVVDTRGGSPRPITPEGMAEWALSPDGALVAARVPPDGVVVHSVDGGDSRPLPQGAPHDTPVGWVHDGLLVARPGDPTVANGTLFLVDVRSGRRTPWADVRVQDQAGIMRLVKFQVTPDGRSRAYSWHRALSSLYVAEGLA